MIGEEPDRCEICWAEEYSNAAAGCGLDTCQSCDTLVCTYCHVGGDDVVDACRGCR